MENPYKFMYGRDARNEDACSLGTHEDVSDPDMIHFTNKYDNDYIWDGETMDEDKT